MTRRATLTMPTLQIMLSLADGVRHGYGIKLDVQERTDGALLLGSGTLYEAIQRLEADGWIEEMAAPEGEGGREGRRFYTLTEEGRERLRRELRQLDGVVRYARERDLLSDPTGN